MHKVWEAQIDTVVLFFIHSIFQLFQTLKPKDQSESTGVGLSLIEKMVTNWGGTIWIESEEGQGSKFIFTIPKKIAE